MFLLKEKACLRDEGGGLPPGIVRGRAANFWQPLPDFKPIFPIPFRRTDSLSDENASKTIRALLNIT